MSISRESFSEATVTIHDKPMDTVALSEPEKLLWAVSLSRQFGTDGLGSLTSGWKPEHRGRAP